VYLGIDVLGQVKSLLDATSADWDKTMDVNGKGVMLCYSAAARQMVKQGHGMLFSEPVNPLARH
jgi:NADP-dependent 3-hydroxy acid dehydrogenase YdfG